MSWLSIRTDVPALPSRETFRQEAARLADEQRLWSGAHGGVFTGREVADFLGAVRAHLERVGWEPVPFAGLVGALMDVAGADLALWTTTRRLLELIVRVHSGARGVNLDAWEGRTGRTWGEVSDLLTVTVQFAREHGPQGGGR